MLLLEVSTEAGRKIGGIYTVLRSKSPHVVKRQKDKYFLIGMYDERCDVDVKYEEVPKQFAKPIKDLMASTGIDVKYGRWVYGKNAPVFLINYKPLLNKEVVSIIEGVEKHDTFQNYHKFLLWKHFAVDSLMDSSWDLTESITWGICAGKLIEALLPTFKEIDRDVVCHFHEWLTGPALLYLKMNKVNLATVFTTHATVLGRSMSSAGRDVYLEAMSNDKGVNTSEAYRYKVEAKHFIERACAHNADVFTTVSETTAIEVEYILEKKPDVITLNGMDFEKDNNNTEKKHLKEYVANELRQFLESYFLPYYSIDLSRVTIAYISGRYEFLNKGFDIFIEGLAKLNERLKAENYPGVVFGLIFSPSAIKGPRQSVINNYLLLDKMGELLESIGINDLYTNYGSTLKAIDSVKDEELKHELLTMKKGFRKDADLPPVNVYELHYSSDIILNRCAEKKLLNSQEDRVKILFYPTYVNTNDGVLNMDYYTLLRGTDIGIFPSRYEPFGYTPVEAGMAKNVAITSDMTGFGRFINSKLGDCENIEHGVIVLKMLQRDQESVTSKLADILHEIITLEPKKFLQLKEDANVVVKLCDWKELIKNYFIAYELALKKNKN